MVCHRILMYFMFDIIGIFKFIALFLGGGNGNPMALQLENLLEHWTDLKTITIGKRLIILCL